MLGIQRLFARQQKQRKPRNNSYLISINRELKTLKPFVDSVVMMLAELITDSRKVSMFLAADFHRTFPIRNKQQFVQYASGPRSIKDRVKYQLEKIEAKEQ